MLVNVGDPIHPDDDAGTGFVGSILPRAGGGFSVFQSSWNYDPATGTTTQAESVRHFDATGVHIDGKIALATMSASGNGGAGKDTFDFDSKLGASNVDRILDFVAAADTIGLDDAIFEALDAGKLKSAVFKDIASSMVDANDRILYDHDTGALFYDADGSGAAKAVQFAVIENHALLTYADIVVV